jgi:hypothetical protein
LVFEEGLATQFSIDMSNPEYGRKCEAKLPALFATALDQFRKLNATDVQILALRGRCLVDDVVPTVLEEMFGATTILAASLCKRVSPHDGDRINTV